MELYLQGVAFGVVPVFFIGPVLFTLMRASLREGFWAGALVATGIAASDVCAIGLCALGVGQILTSTWGQWTLEVLSGVILLAFGAVLLWGSRRAAAEVPPAASRLGLFGSGFVVNFVNPFVFTFWIGAIGGAAARYGFTWRALLPFFGGVITTIFATDLLKARLAEALKHRLTGDGAVLSQRLSGAALGVFGIYFVARALAELPGLLDGRGLEAAGG